MWNIMTIVANTIVVKLFDKIADLQMKISNWDQ